MSATQSPYKNHILAALPRAEFERIAPNLEWVAMKQRSVLYESGGQIQYVYFPATAIVSLHYVLENGSSSEIAGVGSEGVVGTSLFMGGRAPPGVAMVCIDGYGYRLKAPLLMEEFNRGGVMRHLLLCYTQTLITQTSQTAICNRHHSVEQQLSRWLLLTLGRLPANELKITQELIASILGVRREGITEAAGRLQKRGCICYRRGHISMLDWSGMESRVCECYAVVKDEIDHMFAKVQNRPAVFPVNHANPLSRFHVVNARKAEGIRNYIQ